MAFDYGSIDLGLKNPFKVEGTVTAIRGVLQILIGVYLLIMAANVVEGDRAAGWILMGFGIFFIAEGIRAAGSGIFAGLRFFVGRNPPTSLAFNHSKSEIAIAEKEAPNVVYTDEQIEQMMVGRKNSTFVEPKGFIARLLHSIAPNLLFMPYPIRNMAQRAFGAWVKTLTAVVAYLLVAFVSFTGFANEVGRVLFPLYSVTLMFYLPLVWRGAAKSLVRDAEKRVDALGSGNLMVVIAISLLAPIFLGLIMTLVVDHTSLSIESMTAFMNVLAKLHSTSYIIGTLLVASLCFIPLGLMLHSRLTGVDPATEVSELRDNWQETVHPNEIFINLDNLVMANRRYKEVPNRIYRELDPKLNEQAEGKGGFRGEMIQEIQPKVHTPENSPSFARMQWLGLVAGHILYLVASLLAVWMAFKFIDLYHLVADLRANSDGGGLTKEVKLQLSGLVVLIGHLFFLGFLIRGFARLLTNSVHIFYSEIQFDSLLVYFKCEGTFSESKISTGTGIHDSTRSENILVRSSITPWIIVSRVISSTFAATGMHNLEQPRHILEMHKDEKALAAIKNDVVGFLKNRETIASITSERDLGNASKIHQLNQQTRAAAGTVGANISESEAAGFIRKEALIEKIDAESERDGVGLAVDVDLKDN